MTQPPRTRDGFVQLGDVAETVTLPGDLIISCIVPGPTVTPARTGFVGLRRAENWWRGPLPSVLATPEIAPRLDWLRCADPRRYQRTVARPRAPVPAPPCSRRSRRCASTPNSTCKRSWSSIPRL